MGKEVKQQQEEEEEEPPSEPVKDEPILLPTGLQLLLTETEVHTIWTHVESKDQLALLGERLGITAPSFRNEMLLEFHLCNLLHGKQVCLTAKKAAAFQAIMSDVLGLMQQESQDPGHKGEPSTSAEAFAHFGKLMLRHSGTKGPDTMQLFLPSETKMLTDFASQTFFKHFLLYQYVTLPVADPEKPFSQCWGAEREVEVVRSEVALEQPMPTLDLNAATQVEADVVANPFPFMPDSRHDTMVPPVPDLRQQDAPEPGAGQ
mmetsp:Transcript_29078/g.64033  ORF Transcript_29078/g.64033 Transcript_29078/m.64033 type:complete len:261 (-) Transcript_29078:71-853(-)|eukprot:CAMPEP_0204277770 /NCGR_PEP_ID=MMETSP0468-20130131/29494_1 /ASSEMBLY_ACC=CAM_ASM_000383 /TAXON_ID=2969 /ORGANISM="Oxyrrhis marina" /LENGTH=260 /DNA_ID=CAMNT_0051254603 /DNA_START=45 /DNA_END=827 /DNA_ORIENTATION=-